LILEGQFVTLRPLTVDDAEITLRWRNGPRGLYLQRGAQTVEEQRTWIANHAGDDELNFIIEYTGRPVGMIALVRINPRHKTAELARLLIGEPAIVASAPVVFETELLIGDYVFETLGFHKLYGDIMQDNQAMIQTRLYLGYKQDGVFRDHYIFSGVYKSTIIVSLLEDEYRTVCRPNLRQLIALFGSVS
jgi:RimJ/RimL family protein N-acetyltransferase